MRALTILVLLALVGCSHSPRYVPPRGRGEGSLVVYDPGIARRLEEIYGEDLRFAKEVTPEDWKRRGIGHFLELFVLPIRNQL